MNLEEDIKSPMDSPEVQTRKRKLYASIPPAQVNDVEDPRCFTTLMERLFTELAPRNVQQEGDLVSLGQLRWSAERLHHLCESELNFRVRMPMLQNMNDTGLRLLTAYRNCLGEKSYQMMSKQYLDTLKTLNTLSARVEKWSAAKSTRGSKTKEIE